MANQQTQPRMRKLGSPSQKTGPLRATFPFGLRQGNSPTTVASRSSSGRKNSPCSSPPPSIWSQVPESHRIDRKNHKSPGCPDHRVSPDRSASPFLIIKEKSRPRYSPVSLIKRATSLDTITTPYLKGEWPLGALFTPLVITDPVHLTREQATQTPDEWDEFHDRKKKTSHMRSTSLGTGEPLIKKEMIKARLAKSKEVARSSVGSVQRTSPVPGNHVGFSLATTVSMTTSLLAPTHSKAVSIPHIPNKSTHHILSSVEGLSQEIERLVLNKDTGRSHDDYLHRTHEPTPDGHRAPIAEILGTTRTVDTQTPAVDDLLLNLGVHEEVEEQEDTGRCCLGRCSSGHSAGTSSSLSSPSSRSQSESPTSFQFIPGTLDTSRPASLNDTLDGQKHDKDCELKSIFIREPPDGCERIKIIQEDLSPDSRGRKRSVTPPLKFHPIKNQSEQSYCIPSTTSAFCPLLKPYVRQASDMALRSSPSSLTIETQ